MVPLSLKVAVNLSESGAYLGPIREGTDDIDVQLIFSNAGYILTGFFEKWYAADAGSEEEGRLWSKDVH